MGSGGLGVWDGVWGRYVYYNICCVLCLLCGVLESGVGSGGFVYHIGVVVCFVKVVGSGGLGCGLGVWESGARSGGFVFIICLLLYVLNLWSLGV